MSSFYKKIFLILSLLLIPLLGYLFWHFSTPPTLTTDLSPYQKAGDEVKQSLSSLPALPIQEEDTQYTIEDTTKEGIQITYANKADNTALAAEPTPETKPSLTLHFPKQYATEPIEIQISEGKSILIQDKTAKGDYTAQSLSLGGETPPLLSKEGAGGGLKNASSWLQSLLGGLSAGLAGSTSQLGEEERAYLSYTDASERVTTYYAYGHDQATGEKQLKNWQVYTKPSIIKGEQVAYSFTNAKLRKNENGTVSVYYYGDQELQNDKASAEVDPSLMARAQRTLAKEMGDSIDSGETPANFVIPKPYYINSNGDTVTLDWRLSMDGKDISIDFTPDATEYPLALDPTLSFTAPGMSNTGDVITGEATNNYFGYAMTTGDFNADGKIDLAIGAYGYSTNTGRAYIFYSDGSIPTTTTTADVTITGEATNNDFGISLAAGDFNVDGRIDLAIGAQSYSSGTGRAYIFYNDGSIPMTAATADVTITGETTSNFFGTIMTVGDLNADGKTDLAIGATGYSTNTGRAYIFYNDGSIPTTAVTADVTITGETTSNFFGWHMIAGDINADGKADIAVGAPGYSTNTGRAYIFYNDGSIPTTAATADVTITGETTSNLFGSAMTAGDFNADGKTDLAIGAYNYSSQTGRAYIFYNDGSIPTTAANADVIITGEATNNWFGISLTSGDFNSDGKTDLAVGAYAYSTSTGRAYIFYNDGSIPTTAATADVTITGETTNNFFGYSMTAGDFNADGKTDLAIGAYRYTTYTGRAYIFYSQNGQVNTNQNITGNASGDYFGQAMTTGDFNADGRTDLAVGAPNYSTNTGRVYLFYGDGQIPSTAATADVTITGEATNNYFGGSMTAGDLNADGKTDLAVGASGYSTSTGRAYIFYNDGSIPTTAATADAIITGVNINYRLSYSLTTGDLNADGKVDLVVSAYRSTGFIYIFYNGSIITENASGADITITGGGGEYFGTAVATADWNADGTTDLAVTAEQAASNAGKIFLFYNDGTLPTTAATADITITGQGSENYLGSLTSGDFNADGRIDLAVGAYGYSTSTGRAYIFYNDGSIPTTAATADVIITGETTNNYYGVALTAGDFNNDGRADLVVGAYGYSTNTGRVYFYETRENFAWKLQALSPDTGGLRTGLSGTGQELKITGNASDQFGYAMTTGDFNSDGKIDLAVGAVNASKTFIFYNDGSLSATSSGADVTITSTLSFGNALVTGDFNADGRTDLAVGGRDNNRAYIFYNDGSYPITSATADVVIVGSDYFGGALVAGDFNADGRTDLAVGAWYYSSEAGQVFIFYNDGSIPTTSATADVTITGEAGSRFGYYSSHSLAAGDFNADGRTDLAVGAIFYSAFAGRAYIFYNDGSIPTTAATADVIITGEAYSYLGYNLTAGDLNADGKTDLVAGGPEYNSGTGRAYIFYADGTNNFGTATCSGTPAACDAANADVIITGEGFVQYFGAEMTVGDFNGDGRTDLAVGAYFYSTYTGKTYIFYNDGSIPTTAATADVILTGETTNNNFGKALAAGDLNADGRTDLIVGAYGYASSKGRAYIYTLANDPVITGETTNNSFGTSLVSGDFNADGKTDLAVGASGYSTNTGRVYLFYQDGSIPSLAATADVIITGEASSNYFGSAMTAGDFNSDGKTDLVVGAYGYSTETGRVYLFNADGTNNFGTATCSGTPSACSAANADAIMTGGGTLNRFGYTFATGDLNSDGKTDLVVGVSNYNTYIDRAYIFNGGSMTTEGVAGADVTFVGDSNSYFGISLATGDFNSDGRTDLAVGASIANSVSGRAYIFYNDGSMPTTAGTADVVITGEATSSYFGSAMTAGDLNADGKTDLAIGAYNYFSGVGRAYIFYNDGSIPTTAATADVILNGEATTAYFGVAMNTSDLNADNRTDLVVGASGYSSSTGRAYIFYNDGSIPTTAATADVILTGETTSNYFGIALTAGDFNADGKTDLAIGAYGYSTNTGRVYLFTSEAAVKSPTVDVTTRGQVKFRGQVKLR